MSTPSGVVTEEHGTGRLPSRSAHVLAAAGGAAVVIGSLSPWATFSGFPGKMTLSWYPGGARLFCLVLAATALLAVTDVGGRRRAGLAGALGIIAIAAFTAVALADEGGGADGVGWGAWTTLAGAVCLAVAFRGLPADREPVLAMPGLSRPVAGVGAALPPFALLALVVWGLGIEESSRFVAYLLFVAAAASALAALGVFGWIERLSQDHGRLVAAAALVAVAVFPFTQQGDAYWIRVFASIGVFAVAAIGLNVVVGLAGLLDLGYVAFLGVGAYVGALLAGSTLSTLDVQLPFIVVVLLGACIAAVVGIIIGAPTLRLRGDYLAIVTLGFGEIFRITANNWDGLTRGPNGISGVPDLRLGGFDFGEPHELLGITLPGFANHYFLEVLLLVVAITAFLRLNDSRIGRGWIAIREDEVAAAAMGVDTVRLKLMAFAIGAFMAGAAGTVNAHVTNQVSPDSYTFLESILLVAAVVLGGMGTVPGALLGSAVLFVVPEKLRAFQDYRLLLFGAALVLMMRFRPAGLVRSRRRRLELSSERVEQLQGLSDGPAPATPSGTGE